MPYGIQSVQAIKLEDSTEDPIDIMKIKRKGNLPNSGNKHSMINIKKNKKNITKPSKVYSIENSFVLKTIFITLTL